jgi:hypothetical protein
MRENRETSSSSTGQRRACWEGYKPKPTMNDGEESDNSIVPTKRLNKIKGCVAEIVEGRELTKGNALQLNTHRTQCRNNAVSTEVESIRLSFSHIEL